MKRAICPGSFDPVTIGHIDIFQRAATVFDEVYIGVFNNVRKKPLLTVAERIHLLQEALQDIPQIKVVACDGLLTDYMHQHDISVVVRGLRSVTDYEYEQSQAQLTKALHPDLDTIFFLGKPEYGCISSSVVRELLNFQGDISGLVPRNIAEYLQNRK